LETTIKYLFGNITGLKHLHLTGLERLYRRKVSPSEIISQELARILVTLSKETGRQVAVLISRSGSIEYVVIGDEKSILLPEMKDFPLGRRRLRGLRLVHTHLKGEPINDDDLNDLMLLRLDMLAALDASPPPDSQILIAYAALQPDTSLVLPSHINKYQPLQTLNLNSADFIQALEKELEIVADTFKPTISGEEQAILISVTKAPAAEAEDSIEELKELSRTAGLSVLETFIQRPRQFSPTHLMGEGKLREVVIKALQLGASILVFDQELTPAQARSISNMTELKVIDRSQLILDIFARRAKSLDGKVQVELAQLKYLLPRLTGQGIQMSRLMGGIGGRGPGETKLELDRRRIRDRISKLERVLAELSANRYQRRQKRIKSGLPIISIVGYTNAGKSTLLNSLTDSQVLTENLLFATLDTSTRRLRFPRHREVIITDTVGFIRSLPKSLLGAFKATLEELQDADLLLHVVDCTNPRFAEQIIEVESILSELGLDDKERLLLFNKSDLLSNMKFNNPLIFMKTKYSSKQLGAYLISATDKQSLTPLIEQLQQRFWSE
jgi:GTP-binding protein HflX